MSRLGPPVAPEAPVARAIRRAHAGVRAVLRRPRLLHVATAKAPLGLLTPPRGLALGPGVVPSATRGLAVVLPVAAVVLPTVVLEMVVAILVVPSSVLPASPAPSPARPPMAPPRRASRAVPPPRTATRTLPSPFPSSRTTSPFRTPPGATFASGTAPTRATPPTGTASPFPDSCTYVGAGANILFLTLGRAVSPRRSHFSSNNNTLSLESSNSNKTSSKTSRNLGSWTASTRSTSRSGTS